MPALPALLLRLSLGWTFMASGWGKLHHLAQVSAYFAQLGMPEPALSAPITGSIELACGGMLLLGLGVRPAAALLMPTMAVASVIAHRDDVLHLGDYLALIEVTYLAALALLVQHGGGRIGLDAWRGGRRRRTPRGPPGLPPAAGSSAPST